MSYLWIATDFSYFLLNFFVKYMPGNMYQNAYAMSIAELVAVILSVYLYKCLKLKLTLAVGYFISLAGGLLIIIVGTSNVKLMPVFVLLARFGIAMNLNIIYIGTSTLFPTLFVGQAFGFVNFQAKLLTTSAPMVSEASQPMPMLIFCSAISFAIVASCFIQTSSEQAN